jgi:hypothetical protein
MAVIRMTMAMIIPTDMASTPSMVPGLTAATRASVMVAAIKPGCVCGRPMAGGGARCKFATEAPGAEDRASSAGSWGQGLGGRLIYADQL